MKGGIRSDSHQEVLQGSRGCAHQDAARNRQVAVKPRVPQAAACIVSGFETFVRSLSQACAWWRAEGGQSHIAGLRWATDAPYGSTLTDNHALFFVSLDTGFSLRHGLQRRRARFQPCAIPGVERMWGSMCSC